MRLKLSALLAVVGASALFPQGVLADAYTWINPAGGNWNAAANWNDGASGVPDTVGADTVSVNLNGTYTVVANAGTNLGAVAIGTTSTSGTQTVSLNTFSGFNFTDMTVGPNGEFRREMDGNLGGTGTITVQNGGLFTQANSVKGIGSHHLVVDVGGEVNIASGASLSMGADNDWTVNGLVGGAGHINGDQNGHLFSGTGTIGGTGQLQLGGRVTTWAGGTTVSREIVATGAFLIMNNQTVTIDGTYTQVGGGRSFGAQNTGETASVNGAGAINVTATAADLRFGGANLNNNGGGTFTFSGTGSLNFDANVAGASVNIGAATLNLQRDVTVSGSNGGVIRIGGNSVVNLTGAGNSMTVNSGASLMLDSLFYETRALQVAGGGELVMNGGAVLGRAGASGAIVRIGETGMATLSLTPGTTSTFGRSSTGSGAAPLFRLFSNASVNAGSASTLALDNAQLQIDITNVLNWNLDTVGALSILGNDTRLEALSDDLGDSILPSSVAFSLNQLKIRDAGVDPILTLFDNSNNDGLGTNDVALYVATLDLSELLAGRSLSLAGFAGAERVYYGDLVNPNGVTFDSSKWVQVIPEPASLGLAVLGMAAMLRRERR